MKILKFTNADLSLDVEYVVDLIGTNDAMTVHQIKGLDEAEKRWGLNFRVLPYTLTAFKTFATTYNLKLDVLENGQATTTLVALGTALNITTTTMKDGSIGVVNIETITIPATSAAAQGDYVVLTNWNGETAAVWLDIDAAGTEPTGVKYTGADYQVRVPIVTDGTAAENGTLFYEALSVKTILQDWTYYVTLLDNEDGTVTITQTKAAAVTAADPENIGSTGAGSITAATGTTGLDGTTYDEQITVVGGNSPYVYSLTSEGTTDLPAGLTFNTTTGKLEGEPTAAKSTAVLDITVTDAFGIEDTQIINFDVYARTETDFLTFSMAEQTGAATISTVAHTVAIEVANGTTVTALVATFTANPGAVVDVSDVAQVSGTTANNFTSPVVYTITAIDGSTEQDWTVTVTVAA